MPDRPLESKPRLLYTLYILGGNDGGKLSDTQVPNVALLSFRIRRNGLPTWGLHYGSTQTKNRSTTSHLLRQVIQTRQKNVINTSAGGLITRGRIY